MAVPEGGWGSQVELGLTEFESYPKGWRTDDSRLGQHIEGGVVRIGRQLPETIDSGKILVGKVLELPSGIIDTENIFRIRDLLGTLEKGSNEVRLSSLNSIYKVLGMRSLLSVNEGQIKIFLKSHYESIMELISEYENVFTYIGTNREETIKRLGEIIGEIQYKLSIFYSLS